MYFKIVKAIVAARLSLSSSSALANHHCLAYYLVAFKKWENYLLEINHPDSIAIAVESGSIT